MVLSIVASNIKGHKDLIIDGETGLLYPFGDSGWCAECVRQFSKDTEK